MEITLFNYIIFNIITTFTYMSTFQDSKSDMDVGGFFVIQP